MTRYAIGDIQGCYSKLIQLINKIGFNPNADVLYLVGDLVNRGEESLKVLQWVYRHQDSIICVLGNHDIYLLGRYAKVLKANSDETIQDILISKEANRLIGYLRRCPLIFHDNDYIMSHAGIYPKINFNTILHINTIISNHLLAEDYADFIYHIFGNKPTIWHNKLGPLQQIRFIVNSCTRMRYLKTRDFSLDYKFKGDIEDAPADILPWFKADFDPSLNKKILFGHWAALGFYTDNKVIALDSGCVWGKKLTAVNLESSEIFQV